MAAPVSFAGAAAEGDPKKGKDPKGPKGAKDGLEEIVQEAEPAEEEIEGAACSVEDPLEPWKILSGGVNPGPPGHYASSHVNGVAKIIQKSSRRIRSRNGTHGTRNASE